MRVNHIRSGRSKPGLRPQHLTGLCLVRDLCGGALDGAAVGATVITLTPQRLVAAPRVADIGTAGSCTLLLQAALPCALFAAGGATELTLRGGTDAALAPPVGYLQQVLLPTLQRRLGLGVCSQLVRRGFFPQGGGELRIEVQEMRVRG